MKMNQVFEISQEKAGRYITAAERDKNARLDKYLTTKNPEHLKKVQNRIDGMKRARGGSTLGRAAYVRGKRVVTEISHDTLYGYLNKVKSGKEMRKVLNIDDFHTMARKLRNRNSGAKKAQTKLLRGTYTFKA